MASLATITDLEARLGRTFASGAETTRATALLADASASVRAFTGQEITAGTTTVTTCPDRGRVWLWESPATSITSVVDDDDEDVEYTARLSAGYLTVSSLITSVTVEYDHGFDEVPDDIVAVVCAMAGRAMGVTPEATAFTSEGAGPFTRSIGSAAASGALGMLSAEERLLSRYRPVRAQLGVVPVSPWL